MPRGRKAKPTNENILQILNDKLMMKQRELDIHQNTINTIRNEIKEIEEEIHQEEMRQLTAIMNEKQISFEAVKSMLENHNPAKSTTEEEITGE